MLYIYQVTRTKLIYNHEVREKKRPTLGVFFIQFFYYYYYLGVQINNTAPLLIIKIMDYGSWQSLSYCIIQPLVMTSTCR